MDRNEAIKIVKSHYPANMQMLNEALEFLIPELAESEDEKIKKFITNELACLRANEENGSDRYNELTNAISWLEKQGEQNFAWSEEDEKMLNSALWHVKNSCSNGGKNSGEFEVYNWLKSIKDRILLQQKPADNAEPNFKVGGFIIYRGEKYKCAYK